MLDKSDPPAVPDGYCMSIAYACLLDIVRSISLVVENMSPTSTSHNSNSTMDNNRSTKIEPLPVNSAGEDAFSIQLVNSSWCGLLAALSLLLEARYNRTHNLIIPTNFHTQRFFFTYFFFL